MQAPLLNRCARPAFQRENTTISAYNFYQVGIVAVNLIGETLGKLTPEAPDAGSAHGNGQGLQRPKHTEVNNLSANIKFDAETAQRISDITAAKERAVRLEVMNPTFLR